LSSALVAIVRVNESAGRQGSTYTGLAVGNVWAITLPQAATSHVQLS